MRSRLAKEGLGVPARGWLEQRVRWEQKRLKCLPAGHERSQVLRDIKRLSKILETATSTFTPYRTLSPQTAEALQKLSQGLY
jgi:hypothetical protein